MKTWKLSLLTIFGFLAFSSVILFASCEQDPCVDLDCQNGGACSDGYCQCPTGFEGPECKITAASRFVGTYVGSVRCDNFPIQADTVSIVLVKAPNQVELKMGVGVTALHGFGGIAETPETHFVTHVDDDVTIHAYVTVDGNLLYIYLETIDKRIVNRQICKFTGVRVSP
jgi:hypothetical protein